MKITNSYSVAIVTKSLGPTNTKPLRIKATANGNSVTILCQYKKNVTEAHQAAALALVKKMGWGCDELIGGGTETGEVFVMVTKRYAQEVQP